MHRKSKVIIASLLAVAMVAPMTAQMAAPLTASAGEILGETTFEHKALPWQTCETSPAKQDFEFKNGAFHITIKVPEGGEKSKWDLQFRHRNLTFRAGHTYKISCDIKASRNGMEICSKIGHISGKLEWCDMKDGKFIQGPHYRADLPKDGNVQAENNEGWGNASKLTTEYQTFSGEWTPKNDYTAAEWAFHFAKDSNGYGGNAQEGDEIWFDNMSIVDTTGSQDDADPTTSYGMTNRDFSGLENNFISVNQIGYYTNLAKTATLGDNKGDPLYGSSKIDLTKDSYEYELIDAKDGSVAHTGTTGKKMSDPDSGDSVCKIDFSEFKTPGRYYLQIKGEKWRSFEFNIGDNIYSDSSHDMLTNALNYFYQNRSGCDIEAAYITSGDTKTLAHEGGHKTDTASVQKIWKNEYLDSSEATSTYASSKITASGGWYDAGDHGKYVVNGGISIWTLQNMYERALGTDGKSKFEASNTTTMKIPEGGDKIPDVLDECAYELDWIAKMKVESSEPTWGKYAGLYYHKLHDHKWTGLATRPWDYEDEWKTVRIVKPPTFAATLNYAACAAQAARLWNDFDSSKAATYLSTAKDAFAAVKEYWYEAKPDEEHNEKSLYAPMNQAKGGGPYGDNEVRDDQYWAACELFITCKALGDADADKYLEEMSSYKNAFKVPQRIVGGENVGDGSFTVFNWGNTGSAGSMSLLLHEDYLTADQKSTLEASLLDTADAYIKEEEKQGYGIPYKYDGDGYTDENNLDKSIVIKGYEWGSNSMVINNLIAMSYAYDVTGDVKYMNGVVTGMNYLLGCNPLAFSYITGYGEYHEKNPHHRYWSHELDDTLPMAPDGVLSGGPNAGLQDPYVRALSFYPGEDGNPSQRCFVDSIEAWSTNEVTINWNAPLAWIVSFMQDEAATAGTKDPKQTETTPTQTTKDTGKTDPKNADWGDADCNGAVDVSDAVLLAKFINQDASAKITDQGQINANVIKGDLDSDDLSAILMYIARMISKDQFPLTELP
jgi:endoglucanase